MKEVFLCNAFKLRFFYNKIKIIPEFNELYAGLLQSNYQSTNLHNHHHIGSICNAISVNKSLFLNLSFNN